MPTANNTSHLSQVRDNGYRGRGSLHQGSVTSSILRNNNNYNEQDEEYQEHTADDDEQLWDDEEIEDEEQANGCESTFDHNVNESRPEEMLVDQLNDYSQRPQGETTTTGVSSDSQVVVSK
jgi:hypothetical protein